MEPASLTAILGIIGTIVGMIVWLVRRRALRNDDPNYQHQERVRNAEDAIANGKDAQLSRDIQDMRDKAK